ncbi:hypothetical protein [Aliiroseovarius sp. YM-037]|uniref:hypothetical protein n=1 Tax=Aliiroseovarius sp. YM-037 TaxID=3341728 RepID=UPI003A8121DF
MSDPLHSPPGHHRRIWVFSVDLPEDEIPAFNRESYNEDGDMTNWPLKDALGVPFLDHDFIELFNASDIKEYGLSRYLTDANGMAEKEVAPDAEKLDALKGHILLVLSEAFDEREVRLNPKPPLNFLGVYKQEPMSMPTEPLRSESAKGILTGTPGKTPPPPEKSGLISKLLVAAFLLVLAIAAWLLVF